MSTTTKNGNVCLQCDPPAVTRVALMYEYGKVFFNGDIWELLRPWPGEQSLSGEWCNDIEALNALAQDGWELVSSFYEPADDDRRDVLKGVPNHMVRRPNRQFSREHESEGR